MTVNAASVARRLVLAGARIVVALEVPGGTKVVELDPGDAQDFLDDPFGWKARYWGVTAAQLERWHEQDRMPRCGATTKAGKRCRNALSPECDPTDFVSLDGGYCAVHA